ncbi:OmpW family protein [Ramlibacter sp. WS9]|uniref:OmpW/AlkL family protein n=1 Tax=Ramlibacter sp. WS9 TaxID=1882741 RepID=UPI0013051915|nr:OmpW family outer membrane protein [Ramlibacter sp. WS9]
MKLTIRNAALAGLLMLPGLALAQSPNPWWVHVGPVNVTFHTSADVSLGGAAVPGAGLAASSNTTLGLEVGYDLTPNLAARVTVGVPPTTRITGTGPLAGAGELGRLKYGPAVASLTWAFDGMGAVRPYLGAGINYTIVLASKDGVITSLDAKNAFGGVLQAGVDLPLDKRWGVFLDVKKIFLKTTATGMVGPAPANASVRLNPLLVHAGVSYRF